ncbi:hypothetical protein FRC10_000738, partial [Ceratobasidium sp. 414]
MVEERGAAAILGYDPGSDTDGSVTNAGSKQDSLPSDPLAPYLASTFSPDPSEIKHELNNFINKPLSKDTADSPDDWDSESNTSGSSASSLDKDESESKSNADSAVTNDFEADLPVFEPIIEDGELNQSSIYTRTKESSMVDLIWQLESSLAELSMEDPIARGSPELEVSEPEGEYSFLGDSPASSDRTSTPPNRFLDDSMANANPAVEVDHE